MPLVRVYSVPLVSPGFNPAEYLSGITPEARETALLYRQLAAQIKYVPRPLVDSTSGQSGEITDAQPESAAESSRRYAAWHQQWVEVNAELIPKLLAVSRRESCAFNEAGALYNGSELPIDLIRLLFRSGQTLTSQGKFAEALEHYIAALRMVSQFSQFSSAWLTVICVKQADDILDELPTWAAQKGQTPAQIRTAIEKLKAVGGGILHLADGLKREYIVEDRGISHDESLLQAFFSGNAGNALVFQDSLLRTLMPWEKYRRLRELNYLSQDGLSKLLQIQLMLDSGMAIAGFYHRDLFSWYRLPITATWAAQFSYFCNEAPRVLAKFETTRRATMIILALEAYRLEHGTLPQTLAELKGTYFDKVPLDPYAALPFVYFRDGLPKPETALEAKQLEAAAKDSSSENAAPLTPGMPCIWCTGRNLWVRYWENLHPQDADDSTISYYAEIGSSEELPRYVAWGKGCWFPIPEQ